MKFLSCILLLASVSVGAQTTVIDSIHSGGQSRQYYLYVPAAYDGSEPRPLVLNLHGYGSYAFQQIFYGEFRPIAVTANFLILLPDGTQDVLGFQHWNTFNAFGTGVDDVAFISDLLDSISAEYNIDQNRIYSTGMSNGGFMSYELACQLSDRIAAIASVTGTMDTDHFDYCSPSHPTPVMEIHGTADATVPYAGSGDFLPIDELLDYWISYNNCNTTPEFTEIPDTDPGDGSTVEHYIWSGGDNGVSVEHFKVINGGHTWPGTILLLPASGSTNKDINASAEIWRFFSRYSLDVLTDLDESDIHPEELLVYPNPGNGLFVLEFPGKNSPIPVLVKDLSGRLVMTGNSADEQMDIRSLPAGIYMLTAGNAGTIYIKQ